MRARYCCTGGGGSKRGVHGLVQLGTLHLAVKHQAAAERFSLQQLHLPTVTRHTSHAMCAQQTHLLELGLAAMQR